MINRILQLAEVFKKYNIEYLIIDGAAAILYGYPGTTQDIDIFPKKSKENCLNLIKALIEIGFELNEELKNAIIEGRDFIQIRLGPFPLDIVFAPDGIDSFEEAKRRAEIIDGKFHCASIDEIIKSKRASKRQRDIEELPRLEAFQEEIKKRRGGLSN